MLLDMERLKILKLLLQEKNIDVVNTPDLIIKDSVGTGGNWICCSFWIF
jgi:hypothetical protein